MSYAINKSLERQLRFIGVLFNRTVELIKCVAAADKTNGFELGFSDQKIRGDLGVLTK